jgi:outer membrane protein assembly factor BamA
MKITTLLLTLCALLLFGACSTTDKLEEGDVLYTGIGSIDYNPQQKKKKSTTEGGVVASLVGAYQAVDEALTGNDFSSIGEAVKTQFGKAGTKEDKKKAKAVAAVDKAALSLVQEEVDAALECAPNGSFMGSSYYRSPFPVGLWCYNAFLDSKTAVGKWIFKSFATYPVLVSSVNPELRTMVATTVLHNYGFFNGKVEYDVVKGKNPKKAKIDYVVRTGTLYRLGDVQYLNFPQAEQQMLDETAGSRLLKTGDAFSVLQLDAERTRILNLFRNNGYYYYQSSFITYRADTVQTPGQVQLQVVPMEGIPEEANRKWYIGKTTVDIRRSSTETLDSVFRLRRGGFTFRYGGDKMPVRGGAILHNVAYRKGEPYNADYQDLTLSHLQSMGIFSSLEMNCVRRDSTESCDTLDVEISGVLDKPYDAELDLSVTTKSNSQTGPGAEFTLSKLNAFRGGEKLSLALNASYEWQTGGGNSQGVDINSYSYGASIKLESPRLLFPFLGRRLRRSKNTSIFAFDANRLNRSGYYNMVGVGLSATYQRQPNDQVTQSFTPLSIDFDKLMNTTPAFDEIVNSHEALYISMRDQFVPAMSYGITLTSRATAHNPRSFTAEVKEAGNVTSGIYALAGKSFSEKNKELFGNPFAQFVKLSAEYRESFTLTRSLQLATRFRTGILYAYGNSDQAPYSEQFYVGGANSIRAYTVRSIGPGSYHTDDSQYSYLDQTGDFKLEANVELRFPLYGSLNGAIFLDAGNVWLVRDDPDRPGGIFKLKNLGKELATGTGFGFRYDMDFLVLRLDVGIGIHLPYETGKSGYYNIPRFKDGLGIHFAVGYPF